MEAREAAAGDPGEAWASVAPFVDFHRVCNVCDVNNRMKWRERVIRRKITRKPSRAARVKLWVQGKLGGCGGGHAIMGMGTGLGGGGRDRGRGRDGLRTGQGASASLSK